MQPPIPGLESYVSSGSANFDPRLRAALEQGLLHGQYVLAVYNVLE